MVKLSENKYGKSRIRLMKVKRDRHPHLVVDWTVSVLFRGDYDTCFTRGDNTNVLPTDTMKNTVYSLARKSTSAGMEEFAIELARHFQKGNPEVFEVTIEIAEKTWAPLSIDGKSETSTFVQSAQEIQTVELILIRNSDPVLTCGLKSLVLLKTAHSQFAGFKRDALTTLKETTDRLLGTNVTCRWKYQSGRVSFDQLRSKVRKTILAEFAHHHSLSVQHTLYAMAERVLDTMTEIAEITLILPNRHCLLVDLSPFGQDNPNEIFLPVDEPHGYIEATLRR